MSRRWCNAAIALILAGLPQVARAQESAGDLRGLALLNDEPVAGLFQAGAESPASPANSLPPAPACGADPFAAGATSTQVLGGAYFSAAIGPRIPFFNYVPLSIRSGWMLTSPEDHCWGRGNYECLVDVTGALITSKYGNWFAGPTFFLRANLLEFGPTFVPYTQVGAGGVVNDAYKEPNQHAIGEAFEFYLHWEWGVRCFVAPNLSLDVEGGLQHISNGGLASRNYGMNAFGAAVGLTYSFPWGQ
jgi:Lipid A 3-O-deacylase (PagL)